MEEWHRKICSLKWTQFLKALAALNLDPTVFTREMSPADREIDLWPMLSGKTPSALEYAYHSAVAARLSGERHSKQEPENTRAPDAVSPQGDVIMCYRDRVRKKLKDLASELDKLPCPVFGGAAKP